MQKHIAPIMVVALLFLSLSTPIYASSISDDAAKLAIQTTLSNGGIEVPTISVADGRDKGGTKSLIIGYVSTAQDAKGIAYEIGAVLGTWTGEIKNGWDCDELSAVIGDANGKTVGMWYCSKEWKDAFLKGDMNNEQLLLKVFATVTKM